VTGGRRLFVPEAAPSPPPPPPPPTATTPSEVTQSGTVNEVAPGVVIVTGDVNAATTVAPASATPGATAGSTKAAAITTVNMASRSGRSEEANRDTGDPHRELLPGHVARTAEHYSVPPAPQALRPTRSAMWVPRSRAGIDFGDRGVRHAVTHVRLFS
jgi:hypothetical protein